MYCCRSSRSKVCKLCAGSPKAFGCAGGTEAPLLKQRAGHELAQIEAVRIEHAKRVALVPVQTEEPVGVERLLAMAEQ